MFATTALSESLCSYSGNVVDETQLSNKAILIKRNNETKLEEKNVVAPTH